MDFTEYRGRRVVVTGASSGIGYATAQALLDRGAEVIGAARRGGDLPLAAWVTLDLADPDSIEAAAQQIGERVDVLVNCAGASPLMPPLDILKVNFLGTRLFTERALSRMGRGSSIVNVSSDGGYAWRTKRDLVFDFLAAPDFHSGLAWYEQHTEQAGHPYAFGKEALDVWTMQQAQVLIQQGIRVNTLSPGAVQTPMLELIEANFPRELIAATEQPSGRRSTPEEQVGPILFLGSDAASYVNGVDLQVDGGFWAQQTLSGQLG